MVPDIMNPRALPRNSRASTHMDDYLDFSIPLGYWKTARRPDDAKFIDLGYVLMASIVWTAPYRTSNLGPQTKSLPVSVLESRVRRNIWNVKWKILSAPEFCRCDLQCVLCRQDMRTMEELRFHLSSAHVDLRHHVTKDGIESGDELAPKVWSIKCVTQTCLKTDIINGGHNFQFVNSGNPIDMEQFLAGDDSQPDATGFPELSREILDLPRPPKKRYRVTKELHKVKTYRAVNKRELQEGELVSESDDDVDTEWLNRGNFHRIMQNPEIPEPTKRFVIKFDEHIRGERVNSDKHLGDAIVRFVRLHGAWLCTENLCNPFVVKLNELLEDQLITQEVHNYCLHKVREKESARAQYEEGGSAPTGPREQGSRRVDKGKRKAHSVEEVLEFARRMDVEGDVEVLDAQSPNHREHPSDETPPLHTCLCGEDSLNDLGSLRQLISCENDLCTQPIFHLDCVLQHWYPMGRLGGVRVLPQDDADWHCKVCSSRSGVPRSL
ncbi:hypothetical protein BDV96DRAFT_643091 [Lophiotrema nucula]|uniref:C2H2-type domain-containing protein n=1 Tax=Lophiotrema nucula TaxID=690887 RepID=A0A6A5ZI49_9PLEO|nr:hypothetical protein BDV96DRAFT_643091 [Lophiotrema nucula]